MLNAIEINNWFFINIVRIIFILGLSIEIVLIVNYYRETGKKAKQKNENRDLSIFSKGNIRSPLHFIPTLLTAIGILGTFWGISQGLKGIALENINDTDALLNNSTELLAGMKTAFQTSLWGLGGASLFIFILAISETLKRIRRNNLIPKIRQNSDQNTTQALINQLGNVVEKMEGLATLNAKNIGEEVATALKPIFGEIQNDLNPQRQTIENQRQELLKTLIGELKNEVIEPVVTRLDESAEMTREASHAVKELREQLGGISESLATSIQTIQQFQEETLGQLEAFAQNLQQILEQFKTDTQGVMEQMATDIHNAVNESISGMEAQRTAASDMMGNASDNLNGTLTNIDSMLQNTRQTAQQELENFRLNYQESLNQFFEQQNNLLEETLGKQREGLEEVVKELQRVFQEDAKNMTEQVIESMNTIQTTTKAVSDLANTTGLTSAERLAQIQEIARTLGNESKQINQAYQNLIYNFNQGLETWNENLTQYFEQANETYQQGRQESEQAAAEVCNQLNQTSQGLMSVANYLVATAEDLNNSNSNR